MEISIGIIILATAFGFLGFYIYESFFSLNAKTLKDPFEEDENIVE
jgi:hypothetical protein